MCSSQAAVGGGGDGRGAKGVLRGVLHHLQSPGPGGESPPSLPPSLHVFVEMINRPGVAVGQLLKEFLFKPSLARVVGAPR
jgi:hypothetical protein